MSRSGGAVALSQRHAPPTTTWPLTSLINCTGTLNFSRRLDPQVRVQRWRTESRANWPLFRFSSSLFLSVDPHILSSLFSSRESFSSQEEKNFSSFLEIELSGGGGEGKNFLTKNHVSLSFLFSFRGQIKGFCFRSRGEDRVERVFLEIELLGREKEEEFFMKNHVSFYYREKITTIEKGKQSFVFDFEKRIDQIEFFQIRIMEIEIFEEKSRFSFSFFFSLF